MSTYVRTYIQSIHSPPILSSPSRISQFCVRTAGSGMSAELFLERGCAIKIHCALRRLATGRLEQMHHAHHADLGLTLLGPVFACSRLDFPLVRVVPSRSSFSTYCAGCTQEYQAHRPTVFNSSLTVVGLLYNLACSISR